MNRRVYLLARHASGKFIGFREQRALARYFPDLAGKNVAFQKAGNNLFGGQSLRNRQGVLDHLAFSDCIDNVGDARLSAELIFAILQLATGLEHDHSAHEHIWLINDALALQKVGYDGRLTFELAGAADAPAVLARARQVRQRLESLLADSGHA